jgi:hypothetical protein
MTQDSHPGAAYLFGPEWPWDQWPGWDDLYEYERHGSIPAYFLARFLRMTTNVLTCIEMLGNRNLVPSQSILLTSGTSEHVPSLKISISEASEWITRVS